MLADRGGDALLGIALERPLARMSNHIALG
jgi:hypothetical protein